MSNDQGRRRTTAKEFASLFLRFTRDYGKACGELVAQLRERYPEITKPSRRTGKALRPICFFVWCCCRDEGDDQLDGQQASTQHDRLELIPPLVHAAVLLSAQDDYFDNSRIPAAQKDSFCQAINRALLKNSFERDYRWSLQLRDLTSLWSYVAETIPSGAPEVRSYWVETACQMNDAMSAENRTVGKGTITYEEYMRTAVRSIGMAYMWATYLAYEHIPVATLHEMAPLLVHGSTVVRLSNDIAGFRQGKNKENAVTLMNSSSPCIPILRRALEESRVFRQGVKKLDVEPHVRDVLLRSVDLMREFYQLYDFDHSLAE